MSHRFEMRREGETIVVRAAGELDAYAAPELRDRLDEALADTGKGPAELDLSAVEFLDSTALGTVVGAFRRATESGRPFTIVAPRGHARRIFRITRLDTVLPLVEPDGEA